MGAWGVGVFDNDNALDYLLHVKRDLIERITECLGRPIRVWTLEELSIIECGDSVLLPSIEILCLICETYHTRCFNLPVEVVDEWQQRFLSAYDEVIDEYRPKQDYKIKRREVIVATFERFKKICREAD